MKLWTFQSLQSLKELEQTGMLTAKWSRYTPSGYWAKAYQWMVGYMKTKNVDCGSYAPIWAFHSCNAYEQAPTYDDAYALLSQYEIEKGIKTIIFECPDNQAVLTNYNSWNQILDQFIAAHEQPINITTEDIINLEKTQPSHIKQYNAIQATLPFLKLEWVKDIRILTPNYPYVKFQDFV